MTIVLRLVAAAMMGLAWVPGPALAEGASPWANGFHSRARLLSGGSTGADQWTGIEIVLDPGFKTYWREPGESGLPPRFDWSGSLNAAAIDLHWPAPSRTQDAGGVAYTYAPRVVFPVRVRAADPAKPVTVHLAMEYGVCKEICIPAQASLELTLRPGEGPHRAVVEQALARVPRRQALGAEGPLAVTAVERVPGDKPTYRVQVRSQGDATLFAEAPENWFVSTSMAQPDRSFTVAIEEKPKDATGPVPLRLTLVSGEQAVETEVVLQGSLAAR
jgi:DsbC/DsbD-like thiol-disulfide interchange protein